MIRWWGKFFPPQAVPSKAGSVVDEPARVASTVQPPSLHGRAHRNALLQQQNIFPRTALFNGSINERLFALIVEMLGNPSSQTIQNFFQRNVPELVVLVRSKPALIKTLATYCEKMPSPFGAFVGLACGAHALADAQSGLTQIDATDEAREALMLAALRRIYAFNPQAANKLVEQLGTQGSLANRIRVLELVLTSQAGNRHSMNHILEGIAQNASPKELNDWIYARLLALSARKASPDRNLAFKQGWLTTWVKGWLGEEFHNKRLSPAIAAVYQQRFDPRA